MSCCLLLILAKARPCTRGFTPLTSWPWPAAKWERIRCPWVFSLCCFSNHFTCFMSMRAVRLYKQEVSIFLTICQGDPVWCVLPPLSQHQPDPAIGVHLMDRYTFYVLEFLEEINPASQTNMNDLVSILLILFQHFGVLAFMWFPRSVLCRIPVGAVFASWCALLNFKIMLICLCGCVYVCMCVYMCMWAEYVCMCVHVCMCAYMCMWIGYVCICGICVRVCSYMCMCRGQRTTWGSHRLCPVWVLWMELRSSDLVARALNLLGHLWSPSISAWSHQL